MATNPVLEEAMRLAEEQTAAALAPDSYNVQTPLLADPSYSAYLRKLQLNESQTQSALQAAQAAALRRLDSQAGMYDYQRMASQRGVNQDFESRGMLGAGRRLSDISEKRSLIDYGQGQAGLNTYESNAAAARQAAQSIASGRAQRAEEELAARGRLAERSVTY